MSYRFLTASATMNTSPKTKYIQGFQELVRSQFYNSSDWFTISEETALASGVYQNIDVRINSIIDTNTGEKIQDDFKKLLFIDINHSVDVGRLYQFDNNYWLTINVDKHKTLAADATIKRCNNTLRWQDSEGAVYEVPCSLGYGTKLNRDYATAGINGGHTCWKNDMPSTI